MKNKKATTTPINKKDGKCFQSAIIVALNHEEIKKDSIRITKIKLFIKKSNNCSECFVCFKRENVMY